MGENVETREIVFDDGVELVVYRRGSKIYMSQRV